MAGQRLSSFKSVSHFINTLVWTTFGAFLVALALKAFLIPNNLIDGGIVGASMIFSHVFGNDLLPYFLILFNLPFILLAYNHLGKYFVIQMFLSIFLLAMFIIFLKDTPAYKGDTIEVIFAGGLMLGIGIGLIIRKGGALDGSEIIGIIINRQMGYTVGQVVLFFNIFIFALAGWIYNDWHTAVQSLMTFIVVIKIMDTVIVGLEETKAVFIISANSDKIAKSIMHELGLGLTILYGRGGFSGGDQELLYVIIERLQLAELKELIHSEDPKACIAIENLHEVVNGRYDPSGTKQKQNKKPSNYLLKHLWQRARKNKPQL